jgi:hypothetical protein
MEMISNRILLMVVGIIVFLMGVLAWPGLLDMADEPAWHAGLKIIVGLILVVYAYMSCNFLNVIEM